MLKLILTNGEVVTAGRDDYFDELLLESLRFKTPKKLKLSQSADKDGYIPLYDVDRGAFPLGLLTEVEEQLLIEDIEYDIIDKRNFTGLRQIGLRYYQEHPSRDYQIKAMRAMLKHKRGIIALPMGTGKTRVVEDLVGHLQYPTVFYVGRERLLNQTWQSFRKVFNTRIGKVGDGVVNIAPITVATVQTVSNLPSNLFTDYPITVFDECHHVASDTVFDIAQSTQSEYVFGLSATPTREDNTELLLEAGIGPVIFRRTISEMMYAHWLANVEIKVIQEPNMPFTAKDSYQDVIQRAVVHNNRRNEKIALTAVDESLTGKVYIHVNRVDHGPKIQHIINKRICSKEKSRHAEWLHGKSKNRDEIFQRFKDGDLKILISTLLGEGIDVPDMYCLILASGGKSRKVALPQIFGRVIRLGKHPVVRFYDIMDMGTKYLWDHFLERCKFYNSESAFWVDPIIKGMGAINV